MKVKVVTLTEDMTMSLVFKEEVTEKEIVKAVWYRFLDGMTDEPSPFPETVEAFNDLGVFEMEIETQEVLEG